MTRDNLIVPLTARSDEISRRKWILLFEQQISLLNVLIEEKNCTMTKRIYIHKGMVVVVAAAAFNWIYCLPCSLSLQLLSRSTRLLYGVCRMCHHSSIYRLVMMNNRNGDTICSMYQLRRYWKKYSVYINWNIYITIIFYLKLNCVY